eukprot:NODE_1687_length_1441_cov_35.250000_g1522_i0.p1 GENE.NODE_1687_length_1441_cov_35.250000_g1522_i0~~NODE_1687_length_1441_cov_35.250000_g1522_i0.p1  ORF type:complete len:373 (+),score=59.31 NODE_1687_length_1441_cov_35.250000_g1522_i0:107-1225(+)
MDIRAQRNISLLLNCLFVIIFVANRNNDPCRIDKTSLANSPPSGVERLEVPPPALPPSKSDIAVHAEESSSKVSLCVPQIELMGPGAKARRGKSDYVPTFSQAHLILYGKDARRNVYREFKNCAGKEKSKAYTQSNINQTFANWLIGFQKPQFVVEVGSFTGISSMTFGQAIINNGLRGKTFMMCIDTWLGDLNMVLNKDTFASTMSWRAGEPELYEQWMANIVASNLTDVVLPLRQSSILGARFLKAVRWVADLIFLDSAHEVDETFNELVLYWDRLRAGGILLGDDYVWRAVRHDVMKFVSTFGLHLERPSELLWYIRKPMDFQWPRTLFRKSFGYYGEDKDVFADPAKRARYRALLAGERKEGLEAMRE